MSKKKFDLNLFRVLDAIYTHGNTTQAARALHLSQPAVSHALARLRELLNDPLFVRQGARMVPSPYTSTIIPQVQRALRSLRDTLEVSDEFELANAERAFRIGFRDVLESICLPPLLAQLGDQAPGLQFHSVRMRRDQIERELAISSIDLAVDGLLAVGENIRHEKICDEPLAVVGRLGHPAFAQWPNLDAYLAARHVLVTLRDGPEYIDHVLQKEGNKRTIALRCQHYFAACQVTAETDLLQTMPQSYARVLAKHLPITVRPLPFEAPALDVRMFWHVRSEDDPANRWLRQIVAQTTRESLRLIADTAASAE